MYDNGRERRRRRSRDTRTALTYQLDAVRHASDLEAVVLADGQGIVVSSSGDPETCLELAALAPIVGRNQRVPVGARLSSAWIHVRKVDFDGIELFLASASDSVADVWSARLTTWLAETGRGVKRILAA